MEQLVSATLITIMATLAGVEPKFITTHVETNLQSHSYPWSFQLQLVVTAFKATGIAYSTMAALVANRIATMEGPNNITVMED